VLYATEMTTSEDYDDLNIMELSNGILNCTQNPVLPTDAYYASGILTLIQTYENIILLGVPPPNTY